MKKTITRFCCFSFTFGAALLLQLNVSAGNLTADRSPFSVNPSVTKDNGNSTARIIQPQNQTQNIFDIQFNYTLGFASGVSCVYTGTEFWVGPWNKDSIYTLDVNGNITAGFKITGVGASGSGVRAFTYDGTTIYASDNTTTIKKIDPSTKTLLGTITAPSAVRGLAYDSTANGGAGGFWISNFNTDFVLISMTGSVLETITVAEHMCNSVYGIAFDPYIAGGPYIWAFSQGSSGDSSKLSRVNIPTHTNTGIVHNVNADVATTGSIAGSVSVTWRFDPMHFTLMGCTQNTNNQLFGYELADYTPPSVDASVNDIQFNPPFTKFPAFEISPMSWDVTIGNNGTSTLSDVATTLVVDDGVNPVYSPADFHNLNLQPAATTSSSFISYTPPPTLQQYFVTASTNTGAQTDQDNTNDMMDYSFEISDSVMARDNGNATNRLGLPGGFAGVLGQEFELPSAADISSATFELIKPDIGDSVSVDLYTYNGLPDVVIASTDVYVITAADTNGVVLTLPFIGGPTFVQPGAYFLGVNQFVTDSNITLATSPFNYRPAAAYFQFAGGSWTAVEDNNGGQNPFLICYLLRLNMHNYTVTSGEINGKDFIVYPNPATEQLFVKLNSANTKMNVELFDLVGNKIMESGSIQAQQTSLDVSRLAPGIYTLRTTSDGSSSTVRVAIN